MLPPDSVAVHRRYLARSRHLNCLPHQSDFASIGGIYTTDNPYWHWQTHQYNQKRQVPPTNVLGWGPQCEIEYDKELAQFNENNPPPSLSMGSMSSCETVETPGYNFDVPTPVHPNNRPVDPENLASSWADHAIFSASVYDGLDFYLQFQQFESKSLDTNPQHCCLKNDLPLNEGSSSGITPNALQIHEQSYRPTQVY
jgi:hypothetical protein